jgi:hypothetical protein
MRIISVPTDTKKEVICSNPSMHRSEADQFQLREFSANDSEFNLWMSLSQEKRNLLKTRHLWSGDCLLCLLDDSLAAKK